MDAEAKIKKSCPLDSSNIFSKALFSWVIPLFKVGLKKTINHEDLTKFSRTDNPDSGARLLQLYWKKEESKKNGSLIKAIVKTFGLKYIGIAVLMVFTECVTRVSQPLLVGRLIRFFTPPKDGTQTEEEAASSYKTACMVAALYCVTSIAISFGRNHYFFMVMRHAMNVRSAVTLLIYDKILKLSKSSFEETSVGHIVNVVANDLNRFDEVGAQLAYIVAAPLQAIIVICILWQKIGPACLGGMVILFLFVPFQAVMGRLFNKFRSRTTVITDKRVKFMSEIINAMKVIKFYCWEAAFGNIVEDIRRNEIGTLKSTYYLKAVNTAVYFIACRSMLFATFICYLATNKTGLDAETVFVSMSMFNALRIPVTKNFPEAIGQGAETLVACARVQKILKMEEKEKHSFQSVFFPQPGGVTFKNFTCKWNKKQEKVSLTGINIKITPGTLMTVIGSVGSGKTCLLYSILNEIDKISGEIVVNGYLSYFPQETWCYSGTVKENILLGSTFDAQRYNEVMSVCSLNRDIEMFPHKDETLIGEKGYTLSGGQKARITLARAIYRKADIYLLDDPLSAVDPQVASHIFQKCILGFLKEKTVILVTHQLQFLNQSDQIMILNDGKLLANGPYEKIADNEFLSILNNSENNAENNSENNAENIDENDGDHSDIEIIRKLSGAKKKSFSNSEKSRKSSKNSKNGEITKISEKSDADDEKKKREEVKAEGAIRGTVYWDYIRSGASVPYALFCLLAAIIPQCLYQYTDLWLSKWTDKYSIPTTNMSKMSSTYSNISDAMSFNHSTSTMSAIHNERDNVLIYTGLMIAIFLSALIRVISLFFLCLRASINLHDTILGKILRCPLRFFETVPLGRIMNRFTRDLGSIDQRIPGTFVQLIGNIADVLGIVITSTIVEPYLIIPAIILLCISIPFRYVYLETARDVKRLDSITRSPVYSHISTTFDGLVTIRSFNLQNYFKDVYLKNIEDATSTRFWVIATSRCIGFCLDCFALVYLCSVCIYLVVSGTNITPGNAGLVLSSGLLLIGVFQGTIRLTAELETQMVCVERVIEYKSLPQEASSFGTDAELDAKVIGDANLKIDAKKDEDAKSNVWPKEGSVNFNNVSLRYSDDTPEVLKSISFAVNHGDKVGIVGRTGAGKSSLVTVLFRLVDDFNGKIIIDGVDSKSVNLSTLRDRISIIPQDPILFSGTIRRNLDPFNLYEDANIWDALDDANLASTVKSMDGQLSAHVSAGGANLSVGQRQLVCLSRALLKNNKILVLDEATANVDLETDEIIQKTIRKNFSQCTVLTIAHRLNTVIDADKILVMDGGNVAEYDHPYKLLSREDGLFKEMVTQTGSAMANVLKLSAEDSYYNKFPNMKNVRNNIRMNDVDDD